jgi:diguanylate cyclase (GGDEF)-like protein
MKAERRVSAVAIETEQFVGEATYRDALDVPYDGICLVNPAGIVNFSNQALRLLLGLSPNLSADAVIWDWVADSHQTDFRDRLAGIVQGDASSAEFVCMLRQPAGGYVSVDVRLQAVGPLSSQLIAVVVRPHIIKSADNAADSSQVRNDPLTGLPDRSALMDRLRMMLERSAAAKKRFAILFIDVDEFKQVNDRFGHLIGDRVLKEVAERLARCVRSGDHLSRFGGDEFVLLVDGLGAGSRGIRAVQDRIRTAFKQGFAILDGELALSVSVGVAESGDPRLGAEGLLESADRAMYAAKRGGV